MSLRSFSSALLSWLSVFLPSNGLAIPSRPLWCIHVEQFSSLPSWPLRSPFGSMGLLSHLICVATTRRRSNHIGCLITVMINSLRVMTVSTRPNLSDMSGVRVRNFMTSPQIVFTILVVIPSNARANVLLRTDFRYFGVQGTDEYKSKYELIRRAVEGLGRGSVLISAPNCERNF
jgi:hypothetical protein